MDTNYSLLLFLLVFVSGLEAANYTHVCQRIDPSNDIYKFCEETAGTLERSHAFFEKYWFLSPDQFKALSDAEAEIMNDICTRYRGCPMKNYLNCFLPLVDVNILCKKVKILRSPLGDCFKKFLTSSPKSVALESFVKDWTNYGVSKKCSDLRFASNVLAGIYYECGKQAEKAFETYHNDLKLIFDCKY